MQPKSVGVVYSKSQRVIRRIIILDHADAQHSEFISHRMKLHEKEGWLDIPIDVYQSFQSPKDLQNYVASHIGLPNSDRCVVVCPIKQTVQMVCKGDPEIDTHHLGVLKTHPSANIGDKI